MVATLPAPLGRATSEPEMPHKVGAGGQDVLLEGALQRALVVDEVGHAVPVADIGDDRHVVGEHGDVPARHAAAS